MRTEALKWLVIAACLVGLFVAGMSLSDHYKDTPSFCTINERINCDVVNRGPYAEILGIPIAALGVLGYLVFGLAVLAEKKIATLLDFERKDVWLYLAILSSVMFAFALYLTFLEAFIIHAWCILCIMSQLAVLLLCTCSWFFWKKVDMTS